MEVRILGQKEDVENTIINSLKILFGNYENNFRLLQNSHDSISVLWQ